MAGLISGALGSTGYDAAQRLIDPQTDTVAGQVDQLVKKDSPLMQTARAGATQTANSRGLLNSSINSQAGEQAVINAATPIAAADAGYSNAAKSENMQATNRASEFTAGSQNTFGQQKTAGEQQLAAIGAQTTGSIAQTKAAGEVQSGLSAQQAYQTGQLQTQQTEAERKLQELRGTQATSLQTLQGSQVESLQALKSAQELNLQNVKGAQAEQLTQIDNTYKQLLQASSSAASTYVQVSKNINDAMSNPNLDAAAKQSAVDNNITVLQSSLAIFGNIAGIPDLPSLLSF